MNKSTTEAVNKDGLQGADVLKVSWQGVQRRRMLMGSLLWLCISVHWQKNQERVQTLSPVGDVQQRAAQRRGLRPGARSSHGVQWPRRPAFVSSGWFFDFLIFQYAFKANIFSGAIDGDIYIYIYTFTFRGSSWECFPPLNSSKIQLNVIFCEDHRSRALVRRKQRWFYQIFCLNNAWSLLLHRNDPASDEVKVGDGK